MTSAFALRTLSHGLATVTLDVADLKVNIFTRQVLTEMSELVDALGRRNDIACLVLRSGKPGSFLAGADVGEITRIDDPVEASEMIAAGQRLFTAWSQLPFPTIAAVDGTCVGGGTELCLASDYIVVSDRTDARIGLPEIQLGILPAWGGCSRLPRKVGLDAALKLILSGRLVSFQTALTLGLADAALPQDEFDDRALEFAAECAEHGHRRPEKQSILRRFVDHNPLIRKLILRSARRRVLDGTRGNYPAPLRAIEVIEVGLQRGLAAGQLAELQAATELVVSPVCKNLMHLFHLREAAKTNARRGVGTRVSTMVVLGTGDESNAIAELIAARADAGVRLEHLEALAEVRSSGALGQQDRATASGKTVALSSPMGSSRTQHPNGFDDVDLVIESTGGDLARRQQVLAELAARAPGSTILVSTTPSASINHLAEAVAKPERLIGIHFLPPMDRAPMVEIVRGYRTSEATASSVADFIRSLGKTPIWVGDYPGLLVNRLLAFYLNEALWLLDEGLAIDEVDDIATAWGMVSGPFALMDVIGLHTSLDILEHLAPECGGRLQCPPWGKRLTSFGRVGKATGSGFYRYRKESKLGPDKALYRLLELDSRTPLADPTAVANRLVLPMMSEAANCLRELVVSSADELDLAAVMGLGFPAFRGGICSWADQQGLGSLIAILEQLARDVDRRFHPSHALSRVALAGGFHAAFPKERSSDASAVAAGSEIA